MAWGGILGILQRGIEKKTDIVEYEEIRREKIWKSTSGES